MPDRLASAVSPESAHGSARVGTAVLSDDGLYRYELRRSWGGDDDPLVCWIMLNPSTADAERDDWTIGRCIDFSSRWGFGRLVVVNLFALRATDPKALKAARDPIGRLNDASLLAAAIGAEQVIAAWGAHGSHLNRAAKVTQLLTGTAGLRLYCIGKTDRGDPRHPRGIRTEQRPEVYR